MMSRSGFYINMYEYVYTGMCTYMDVYTEVIDKFQMNVHTSNVIKVHMEEEILRFWVETF